MKTGNCVIDFILEALVVIQQVGIWCVDKILKYPILTAIFLVIVFILAAINRTIDTEIRGNLWKWRNK
jgi:hypothetical protein